MGIETAIILGAAAASTAVAASSQKKAAKAAEAQGAANRDAAAQAGQLSDEAFSDIEGIVEGVGFNRCLLYTSPSPRDS